MSAQPVGNPGEATDLIGCSKHYGRFWFKNHSYNSELA